jgi:hypothetical protein
MKEVKKSERMIEEEKKIRRAERIRKQIIFYFIFLKKCEKFV